MNSLASCVSAPPGPSTTKPISCPPTPSHKQQLYCPNCSPNKSQTFMSPNHHHGSHQTISHTHMSHGGHMTTGYGGSGGYVSSSPTKNVSHSPSVQAAGSGHVGSSHSFVTSYKPGPSKFVDRGCSHSESSFTESCANLCEPTTLQSNV